MLKNHLSKPDEGSLDTSTLIAPEPPTKESSALFDPEKEFTDVDIKIFERITGQLSKDSLGYLPHLAKLKIIFPNQPELFATNDADLRLINSILNSDDFGHKHYDDYAEYNLSAKILFGEKCKTTDKLKANCNYQKVRAQFLGHQTGFENAVTYLVMLDPSLRSEFLERPKDDSYGKVYDEEKDLLSYSTSSKGIIYESLPNSTIRIAFQYRIVQNAPSAQTIFGQNTGKFFDDSKKYIANLKIEKARILAGLPQFMHQHLHNEKTEENYRTILELAFYLKILAAQEIKYTENGIELVMPTALPNQTLHPLPHSANFRDQIKSTLS